MNYGEMCDTFIRAEVWSEHATFHAFPSQKLAGSARRSSAVHCAGFELVTAGVSERSSVLLPGFAIFVSSLWPQSENPEGRCSVEAYGIGMIVVEWHVDPLWVSTKTKFFYLHIILQDLNLAR